MFDQCDFLRLDEQQDFKHREAGFKKFLFKLSLKKSTVKDKS